MGLVGSDDELERCLTEACEFRMPRKLRQLFVTILLFCEPKEPKRLWKEYRDHLSEDYARNHDEKRARSLAKLDIETMLKTEGTTLASFGIKVPSLTAVELEVEWNKEDELKIGREMERCLNDDQKKVIEKVFEKLNETDKGNVTKAAYFCDGPGGTGKTFTFRTLSHLLRGHGKRFMAMAYTGCAACLMIDGKTLHKTFDLPVPTNPDSLSRIKPNSKKAQEILSTDVFFVDEAPMCANYMIEAVDKKLRQLTGNHEVIFGGKIFVLSGDLRQVTPVKRYASKTDLIGISLKNSALFEELEIIRLKQNMRALPEERNFAKFLLKVGDGGLQQDEEADIILPKQILSGGNLVEEVFGECIRSENYELLANRVILCPTNDYCKTVNDEVLPLIPGDFETYYSVDVADKGEPRSYVEYPDEFLHSLEASGLPPHELKLKKNVPILLLRNLNISQGLTNGTRLLVRDMKPTVLVCQILNGNKAGEMAFIPRISCTSTDGTFPFELSRYQFPVKLCFSMTCNKSQGSTFEMVGVHLAHEAFSHGMLYTSLSRVRCWDGLRVLPTESKKDEGKVKNIVWKDALL